MRTLLLLTALCLTAPAADSPADKAIDKAVADLEKAKAGASRPDAAKLAKAIASLKAVKSPPAPSLGEFLDDPKAFEGRTLTFRLEYTGGNPLRERAGNQGVPFKGVGPKAPKAVLGLDLPRGLKLPLAFDGDELVVTFACGGGDADRGNVVESIRRP